MVDMKKTQHYCDACGQERPAHEIKNKVTLEKLKDEEPASMEICSRCHDAIARFIKSLIQD